MKSAILERSGTKLSGSSSNGVFVGRQPIYNRQLQVVAYELLFRSQGSAAQAGPINDDQATAQVLLNTFLEIGLDAIVSSHKAFVNFGRGLLLCDYARVLPPGKVVLEVLETVEVDSDLVLAIRNLRNSGYHIALDDFSGQSHLRPLIQLAHIVKIDLPGCGPLELRGRVGQLCRPNLKLLAEKVETRQEFELCKDLGFDYFQGYFLRRPDVVAGRCIPPLRMSLLRLMERLCDPDVQLLDLERLIATDVALTYKLLRVANSALLTAHSEISTVRQALQLVGLQAVTVWTSLFLLAGLSDKPRDVLNTAVVRANMCQLLAEPVAPRWSGTFFLVGLFSVLDVVLDRPMPEVVEALGLSGEVKEALAEHKGILGETLQLVIDYEQGRWNRFSTREYDQATIVKAYVNALELSEQMMRIVNDAGAGSTAL